jgi:hypothetical protein
VLGWLTHLKKIPARSSDASKRKHNEHKVRAWRLDSELRAA